MAEPADYSSNLLELRSILAPSARLREPLARHTSIRAGGTADIFLAAKSAPQLANAVDQAFALGIPWRVIGSASNLLIADEGIEGLVIKAAFSGFEEIGGASGATLVRAQAGSMLAAVGKQLALRGLAGLEWAVNVPGTVGASVVNNSGAFGSCIADHLVSAHIHIPGQGATTVDVQKLGLGYRTSRLKRGEFAGVVLEALYRLDRGDTPSLRARIAEIQRIRRATQPTGYSVGSVFANPPGDSAGRLVESVGLKGFAIGDAQVSTLHANFIVNRGAARSSDVLALMKHIQQTVWRQSGIWLTPEIQLAGRFAPEATVGLVTPPREAA